MTAVSTRIDGDRVVVCLEQRVSTAVIDHDWLPASPGPVTAPYVGTDEALWYRDVSRVAHTHDPLRDVAAAILSLVVEIANLVGDLPRDRVRVTGAGVTAHQVRRRLGLPTCTSHVAPRAVVEMIGDSSSFRAATEAVESGGLIVLAGQPNSISDVNLYKDVHRRGLHVVGARPLNFVAHADLPVEEVLPAPTLIRAGESLQSGLWYRVAQ